MLLPIMTTSRLLAVFAVAWLALFAGCGSDDAEPAPATHTAANGDVYNDADVEFATTMVPLHAEMVQLVVLADDRPLSPDVRDLANAIREARVTEVEQMTDWLSGWDQEIPETAIDHANAGHDAEEMAGSEKVEELQELSDSEFQARWLEVMIAHYEEAIELAQAEQAEGRFADTVAFAETLEQSQTGDLEALQELLDR